MQSSFVPMTILVIGVGAQEKIGCKRTTALNIEKFASDRSRDMERLGAVGEGESVPLAWTPMAGRTMRLSRRWSAKRRGLKR